MTPKQEAFALAYFETGNAAEAYRRAYDVAENSRDSWVYVEACQLLDHPKITLRLQELQEQAAKLSIFTRQKALEELEEARAKAISLDMPAAAVSAINGKVKLFGLDAPTKIKAEVTGKDGGPIQSEEVTARERIARRIAGISARTDAPGDTGGAE
nr:terminase small subunit [Pseudogemmobacter hezensis]